MKSISSISPKTQLCGIIGNPVEHSMSPALHNRAFEELGLDFVYLAFPVQNVKAAMDGMRALGNFKGLSVTIPHKIEVISHLDEVAAVDKNIGSVNTVVKENGKLKGLGSDGPGARQALVDNGANPKDAVVTIMGSGGAARAIGFDLAVNAPPKELIILGVVEEELKELVANIQTNTNANVTGHLITNETLDQSLSRSSILVHATPLGMHPNVNKTAVPKEMLHSNLCVMDIVYNPLHTQLLKDADKKGLKTISGVEMFVNQAVVQFETWTGKHAPKELMRQVVLENLNP